MLEVRDLRVAFDVDDGRVQAVRRISLTVPAASTLAIVGESGCGKSASMMSLLGLLPPRTARILGGSALFEGYDLLRLSPKERAAVNGNRISVIFQDPMTALNPTMRIGAQVSEPLIVHQGLSKREAWRQAARLLDAVQIPAAAERLRQYPHTFSGGMLQRVLIATALACRPALLIADEPTTALDVSIQAQILMLLDALKREQGMAMVLITHDLSVVAQMADQVAVMYAGEIVERGTTQTIFNRPAHPYTLGLKQAMPVRVAGDKAPLRPIEGSPPDLYHPPVGCAYAARCPYAMRICEQQSPPEFPIAEPSPEADSQGVGVVHQAKCWLHHQAGSAQAAKLAHDAQTT